MPRLSIIIVTYNTREALRRCLISIQKYVADLELETIVVDNGSKDGTAAMVREQMPEAVLIEPGYNTWFTGGNNLGMKAAKGDYALILNADTAVEAGTLQTLVNYLEAHPQVGAATCQMRFFDGKQQFICSEVPTYVDILLDYTILGSLFFAWRNRRHEKMWYQGWDRQSTRSVGVIPDSCLVAPRSLLEKISGFDEKFKLYFTEDDICKRIQDQGFECHYVADAVLFHEEHASVRQVQRQITQIYFDDLLMFTRKYYGAGAVFFLRIMILPLRSAMDAVQRVRDWRKPVKA